MTPRVDVFIPNRSYGRWLEQSMDSVLSQEGVDVRVRVIDNASTDTSLEIVVRVAARDRRVSFSAHRHDLGLITSLNEGLAWCEAEYMVLLSADDQLTPGALARATRVLDAHPDVGFVYGPAVRHVEGRSVPWVRPGRLPTRIISGRSWLEHCARTGRNPLYSPEAVARTSLAKQVGFHEDLPHTSDLALWLQLAVRARVGHLTAARQAIYRMHPASLQQTQPRQPLTDLETRWAAFEVLVREDRKLLDYPERILAQAGKALALEAVKAAHVAQQQGHAASVPREDLLFFAQKVWPAVVDSRRWVQAQRMRTRTLTDAERLGLSTGRRLVHGASGLLRREYGG